MQTKEQNGPITGNEHMAAHSPARPMIIIYDAKGDPWLCDKGVNSKQDLSNQGCWPCGGTEMPFSRND